MTGEITAQSMFVVDTMFPGLRWHSHRSRLWAVGLIVGYFGLSALVAFYNRAGDDSESDWVAQIVTMLVMLAAVGIWGRAIERSQCSRFLKRLPAYGKMLRWNITEKGLECRLKDLQNFTDWSGIYQSKVTPEGALVYPQKSLFYAPPYIATPDGSQAHPPKHLFYWLPKTAFTSETDYHRFLELLKAKTKYSTVG